MSLRGGPEDPLTCVMAWRTWCHSGVAPRTLSPVLWHGELDVTQGWHRRPPHLCYGMANLMSPRGGPRTLSPVLWHGELDVTQGWHRGPSHLCYGMSNLMSLRAGTEDPLTCVMAWRTWCHSGVAPRTLSPVSWHGELDVTQGWHRRPPHLWYGMANLMSLRAGTEDPLTCVMAWRTWCHSGVARGPSHLCQCKIDSRSWLSS